MEVDESKPRSSVERSHISPNISTCPAEIAERFQESVKEILEEIEQDGIFTELTAEAYDDKKSYLTRQITELSNIHRVLADQNIRLIEEVGKICPSLIKKRHLGSSDTSSVRKPIRYDIHLSPSGGGFYLSKRKGPDSGSESFTSIKKLLISPASDNELKVKETKPAEASLKKSSNLEDELVSLNKKLQSLEDENTKLKHENTKLKHRIEEKESDIQSQQNDIRTRMAHLETEKVKVTELQKQVDDLNNVIYGFNVEVNRMGEELKASEELNMKINRHLSEMEVADQSLCDNQISELNTKINQYISEIEQLKSTHVKREDVWKAVFARLKMELKEKCESVDDLNGNLETLMSEKDGVTTQLDTLQSDKCSQENLIQEELFNLKKEFQSLTDENTKLKHDFQENKSGIADLETEEVKKQVNDLKLVISDSTFKINSMEEELTASKELNMKIDEYMSEISYLKMELEEKCNSVTYMNKKLDALMSEKDGVIAQLDTLVAEKFSQDSLYQEELVNLNKKLQSLTDENSKLKHEIQENESSIITPNADLETEEVHKQVADLKLVISECNHKIETMFEETHWLEAQLVSTQQEMGLLQKLFDSEKHKNIGLLEEVSSCDDQITELKSKLNQSMSEMVLLKTTHESKEDTLNAVIERLNMELSEKSQSVNDLNEKLEALILENDEVIAQLHSLQDDKIQELEARLNLLKVEHAGVLSSCDISQEVANELKHKVLELESELDMQGEVITVNQYESDTGKLRNDLEEKGKSFDDLNEKLDSLTIEKDEVSAQLDTLRSEKLSQENLIQEMKTRLNSLQAEHMETLASAQKDSNELTQRVLELEREVDMQREAIRVKGEEKVVADMSVCDDRITELNTKIDHYTSEISLLKRTHEEKEDAWNADFRRLKLELQEKCESVDDLNQKLEAMMFEKDGVIAQLDSLRAEKSFLENLIREQEKRLKSLQVGVFPSLDNVQKLSNELQKLTNEVNQKVVELEVEVDRQREVVSDRA